MLLRESRQFHMLFSNFRTKGNWRTYCLWVSPWWLLALASWFWDCSKASSLLLSFSFGDCYFLS